MKPRYRLPILLGLSALFACCVTPNDDAQATEASYSADGGASLHGDPEFN